LGLRVDESLMVAAKKGRNEVVVLLTLLFLVGFAR
jgi:hypothetical protein